MRQLQLFTQADIAAMRDRTASGRYSPAHDEFRRVHEPHRAWGLQQRHARRLRKLYGHAVDIPMAPPMLRRYADETPPPRPVDPRDERPMALLGRAGESEERAGKGSLGRMWRNGGPRRERQADRMRRNDRRCGG
ncbi:hypothetical protein J2S43_000637 [Catenuloplanes nepalensis]|uniref:Uncharacterized protein n=1 Tax=Catenuloplanes nepalensis TaxID=587533 RepID=A0ABT9ML42_9ACTN|nr:hypothetical protein [Catenuloplanes nepalensis]MDP9792125.1 hypothetical protein [Catenuloplanes nepalensis]